MNVSQCLHFPFTTYPFSTIGTNSFQHFDLIFLLPLLLLLQQMDQSHCSLLACCHCHHHYHTFQCHRLYLSTRTMLLKCQNYQTTEIIIIVNCILKSQFSPAEVPVPIVVVGVSNPNVAEVSAPGDLATGECPQILYAAAVYSL
jgi:hypothetical protein